MEIFDTGGYPAMTVAIHQPNFIPWLGYFYKIVRCDIFVLLDNVQYTKNSYINRNRIKTPQGAIWLTVPVRYQFGDSINQVQINNSTDWRRTHLKTLELNYRKTAFFQDVFPDVQRLYLQKDWQNLCEFNIALIEYVLSYLGLEKKLIRSSDLKTEGKSTERLVDIVRKLGGDSYLCGFGAVNYQEETIFHDAGIELIHSEFVHPKYPQVWKEFIPNLSIIDLLFNSGRKSFGILTNSSGEEPDELS